MSERVRVVLVDDHEMIRTGLRTILEATPGIEVVGEAADGAAAIAAAQTLAPDVLCMDVQMPGTDGLAATRTITDAGPGIRVLVLTTFDRDDYLFEALSAGASGFLLKTAPPEAIVEAVRVIARGDALLAPEVTRRVIERFVVTPPPARPGAVITDLTERERDVLALVARGRANAEIAAELHVGEATVKTHVSHMLLKLEVRDRIGLVIWAYEHGVRA
ncbi:MAG: response regulator transcription factor [Micrococcales bacterium]|nr:response regulator transcription factor [Micrococcales bacterium]